MRLATHNSTLELPHSMTWGTLLRVVALHYEGRLLSLWNHSTIKDTVLKVFGGEGEEEDESRVSAPPEERS